MLTVSQCIHRSLCCAPETNMLHVNYISILNNQKMKSGGESPIFSSKSFIVILTSTILLKLSFLYGVRYGSGFIVFCKALNIDIAPFSPLVGGVSLVIHQETVWIWVCF